METDVYREQIESPGLTDDIVGFRVQAHDGRVGRVRYVSADGSYMIVETGSWIFGRKAVVPRLALQTIDPARKTAFVWFTKSEIEGSPACDPALDDDCLKDVRAYYVATVKAANLAGGNLSIDTERRITGEEHDARFSKGQELRGETPEKQHEGRFSTGQELRDATLEKEDEGRFSKGQELTGETPEKQREGRFSEGQEEKPRRWSRLWRKTKVH